MPKPRSRPAHPLVIRLTHWVGAYAMFCMILSGWQIYNASPILPFSFPAWATLGGWLGAGLAWHFAAMWLLVADGLVYLIYGFASGHLRHDFLPISPRSVWKDFIAALTFRLKHRQGSYNAVQKLLYIGVLLIAIATVVTGLSIWKPVQLAPLTNLLGGYDIARRIHFFCMALIAGFIVVHLALVVLVPSTLISMITGGHRAEHPAAEV